jgi:hypothetical protein
MMSEKLRGQSLLAATKFTSAVSMVMWAAKKVPFEEADHDSSPLTAA